MRQWILRVTLVCSLYFKWALEIPPGIQEMSKPGLKEKQSPLLLSRSQTPHEQYPEIPKFQNHNAGKDSQKNSLSPRLGIAFVHGWKNPPLVVF